MHMITLFHILIALISIACTSYLFFRPNKQLFYLHFSLVALTLASGIYLIFQAHARMLEVCLMGIVYIAIVAIGSLLARAKYCAQLPPRIYKTIAK